MVTLQDIIDYIMLESGQFITDFDDTLIDRKILVRIIKSQLQVYNRYYPKTDSRSFSLYNRKVFSEKCDGIVPDSIFEIKGDYGNNFTAMVMNGSVTQYNIISSVNWKYNKPELLWNYMPGIYLVKYLIYHKWDDVNKCINTLDNTFPGTQKYFMDLVTAKFMVALGRSRTAFTLSGFPVDTNASDLISEGNSLYESTMETIRTNSYFHLAVLI